MKRIAIKIASGAAVLAAIFAALQHFLGDDGAVVVMLISGLFVSCIATGYYFRAFISMQTKHGEKNEH